MKYYVYVSDNDGSDKTNEVWVSRKYAPTTRTVDFTWTNDANEPALWEAKESGVAVFDFADKAFFTVKMYKGETMYLDLETAYDKAIAGEMDADADSFYKFDKSNSSFSRAGELVIVSDDETLVPYEIDEDGNFVAVDAEYVKDYAIAHTNSKVNGFVFNTKQSWVTTFWQPKNWAKMKNRLTKKTKTMLKNQPQTLTKLQLHRLKNQTRTPVLTISLVWQFPWQ